MYVPSALPDPYAHADFYDGVVMKRAFAWIIDALLIGALTALVVVLTAFTGLFILPALFMTLGFVYRWIALSRNSATPGMRLVGILFLTRDGQRFDPATAFLHTLGYTVSMSFVLPQIVSIASMMLSPRGQGLTDHILGTVAINRPSGA